MAGGLPEDPEAGVPQPGTELNGGVGGPAAELDDGVLAPAAAPAEVLLDGHKLVPVTGTTGVPVPETGVPLAGMAVPAGMLVPSVDPPDVEAVPDAEVEIAGVSVPSPVL